jgi:DNA-binding transcriptional MocR family regulator
MIASTAETTHDTKAESLAHRVSKAIDQGKLVAGSRLRSIRGCAETEGLSRNTVVEGPTTAWSHADTPRRGPGRVTTCASTAAHAPRPPPAM